MKIKIKPQLDDNHSINKPNELTKWIAYNQDKSVVHIGETDTNLVTTTSLETFEEYIHLDKEDRFLWKDNAIKYGKSFSADDEDRYGIKEKYRIMISNDLI